MDVTFVREFNLVYALILAALVLRRMRQKEYRPYRWANVSYLAAFCYTIFSYGYTFWAGVPLPLVLSALGATVQMSAIMAAFISQVGTNK